MRLGDDPTTYDEFAFDAGPTATPAPALPGNPDMDLANAPTVTVTAKKLPWPLILGAAAVLVYLMANKGGKR